ncbi:MAG: aminopeptidase N [Bermanella sp.]
MKDASPQAIYLKDYCPPKYFIEHTQLTFELFEDHALVSSVLTMFRNEQQPSGELVLHGHALELLAVNLDGQALTPQQYVVNAESLTIHDLPARFTLSIQTRISPQDNTALEGLYKSSKMFCTQCEAEGFRRITYYLDRPDVMSVFETRIIAERQKYPVLLSNGNMTHSEELADGRHLAVWQDPHKKPCYLFALVAGNLQHIEDHFMTRSGSRVTLRIYVESQNIDKCDYAMDALKRAMKWDEEVYGREYDLSVFNIVAVDDFNMGAMENKSLNIFNSSCVLANPKTATDAAYQRIEAIVAHEYFHNWSGNRVTCRDWFQLSLKEGFTVFRDACFSADMGSPTVKRIEDATMLRTVQFAEDAGPMAHAILPASFIEISNFYTVTIYEKGAEVVRMIHNLLGEALFREGSDLYFSRHDGQAVTTDDFVVAMEDASGIDLAQFRAWYHQAGTPEVSVRDEYDAQRQQYTITFTQSCPATPESDHKVPFHIPVQIGLHLQDGSEASLQCEDNADFNPKTSVISLKQAQQTFVFTNVTTPVVPSLLRGLSAPVKLHYPYTREQLLFLMRFDTDGFNRWDAGQALATDIILELADCVLANKPLSLDDRLIEVFRATLAQDGQDLAMMVKMLTLPSVAFLMEQQSPAHVQELYRARNFVKQTLANALHEQFSRVYNDNCCTGEYEPLYAAMARRSLKNLSLQYLLECDAHQYLALATEQFAQANNMTDQSAALTAMVNSPYQTAAASALQQFYRQWRHDPLVINQWFAIQAGSDYLSGVGACNELLNHEAFDMKNPNKVRAVIGVFAGQNVRHFHAADGQGYLWLAGKIIELDALNPQIASRLLAPLTKWKRLNVASGQLMKAALEKILAHGNLSKDVYEVVTKSVLN